MLYPRATRTTGAPRATIVRRRTRPMGAAQVREKGEQEQVPQEKGASNVPAELWRLPCRLRPSREGKGGGLRRTRSSWGGAGVRIADQARCGLCKWTGRWEMKDGDQRALRCRNRERMIRTQKDRTNSLSESKPLRAKEENMKEMRRDSNLSISFSNLIFIKLCLCLVSGYMRAVSRDVESPAQAVAPTPAHTARPSRGQAS